ncbi:MAG: hypothetical protein UR94_C0006G0020 [Parcubacteria group bacterium GW2011_GWA2_36_10]|nr:MAG: hypothetical protein UR94_C0006G0020 [Parcubacteria group bacterium GW2011_GWA2_36_10]
MDFETSGLESKKEVHLEWPAAFSPEEIAILEEATRVYNASHNLAQLGMDHELLRNSTETLAQAKAICEAKGYRLESLIESVQAEAEKKYKAAA